MKNNNKTLIALLMAILLSFSLCACAPAPSENESPKAPESSQSDAGSDTEKVAAQGVWANATYRSDKSLGSGAKTIEVEVKAEDSSVTFTIKTDKDDLGAALLEHGLVEGEQGAYGLYIKKVNGITADYDIDRHYWALSENGTDLMTGADGEKITGGEHYEIVRKK